MADMNAGFRWSPTGLRLVAAASGLWLNVFDGLTARLRSGRMNKPKRALLSLLLGLNRRFLAAGQTRPILVWGALPDGTVFGHAFADPYWSKGGLREGSYEPEILSFLIAVRDIDFELHRLRCQPWLLERAGQRPGAWQAQGRPHARDHR